VPLRPNELFAVLNRHSVEYLLVGGLAVAAHGFERATKDTDIVPEPSDQNRSRLWQALVELEAAPLSLGDVRPEEVVPLTLESLLSGANWDLVTVAGRLDILQDVEGVLESEDDYVAMRKHAVPLSLSVGTVWCVGYDDLLRMKWKAGRDQDLRDIRALREAHGEGTPS
jgi:hypothetical protein